MSLFALEWLKILPDLARAIIGIGLVWLLFYLRVRLLWRYIPQNVREKVNENPLGVAVFNAGWVLASAVVVGQCLSAGI